MAYNAALRCEQRLAILERSETAKRCESLLNALLCDTSHIVYTLGKQTHMSTYAKTITAC